MLAAGDGRRLRPLTDEWPKPLLPIDGEAVIATLVRELETSGVESITVVTGHLGEQLRRFLAGWNVRFAHQPGVLGSADAVVRAMEAGAAPPFLVSAADTVYTPGDIGRFAAAFLHSGAAGSMAPPLWGVGPELSEYVRSTSGPPHELLAAFERAEADGLRVVRETLGPTRDLTFPSDVVRHNFVYLGTEQR